MPRPDPDQLRVITAPAGQNILLYAGPGSGKTRTLVSRMLHLIQRKVARPDELVAVTFSNKAAQELRERVEQHPALVRESRPFTGTFHSLAYTIVRQHGGVVDVPPRFTVCDEALQTELLQMALERVGLGAYGERHWLLRWQSAFSACKRARHDPTDCPARHDWPAEMSPLTDAFEDVAHFYRALLREHNALDFDDLILLAARALYDDEAARQAWRAAHPFLFIDEFHDSDPAQFQLMQLLAPPSAAGGRVMVVLDDQQSIYGWRGASANLVTQFERTYRPRRYQLGYNYRSGGQIVAACDGLLARGGVERISQPPTKADQIRLLWHDNETAELQTVTDEIRRLRTEEGYRLDEIALLYRTHAIGESLEGRLAHPDLPLTRTLQRAFFDQPLVQEVRRYLQATQALGEQVVARLLNFPRVLVDEVAMVHLRRRALQEQRPLHTLLTEVEQCAEVGPGTRYNVRHMLQTLASEVVPHCEQPLPDFMARLFAALQRRRSPFPQAEWATMRGLLAFLHRPAWVAEIHKALAQHRPIEIIAGPSLDETLAAVILAHTLQRYWQIPYPLLLPHQPGRAGALRVVCGAGEGHIQLTARDAGSMVYPAVVVAWQFAAALVVGAEPADTPFVAFDIETSGLSPRYHDIIEVAAQPLRGTTPSARPFGSLIRPRKNIPWSATEIHGIDDRMVRGEQALTAVFPNFYNYLQSGILVGHNPGFDLSFIRAACEQVGLPDFAPPVLDTHTLARRLLPTALDYSLEGLVRELKLPTLGQAHHRALPDVNHTAALFDYLWRENQWDQQLHWLTDTLPLVGAVLRGQAVQGELATLRDAAVRTVAWGQPQAAEWERFVPPAHHAALRQSLTLPSSVPAMPDDRAWAGLQNEWQRYTARYLQLGQGQTLADFLAFTALIAKEPDLLNQDERLQLMTIHAAKGREFRAVFLVGLEKGTLPSALAKSEAEQAEERRVCYVGMSRAKEYLYLLGCEWRAGRQRAPSPYWFDIQPFVK